MAKPRSASSVPACYAMVLPGLEEIAAEEIQTRLGGEIKRSSQGVVVFRVPAITPSILELRTTEDVFLLGWGSDELTHRAEDVKRIREWTARQANWNRLLQIQQSVRPRTKGRPTYRVVAQMMGRHVYRRMDARKGFVQGLVGKFPANWVHVEENPMVEFWLTIQGSRAISGVRLSDRTMRHRTYKREHIAASLRPTMAAAMIRVAELKSREWCIDPMCGAGTILAEALEGAREDGLRIHILGGDRDMNALRAAYTNLRRLGGPPLLRWDALHLPIGPASADAIVSNPPFGKQLGRPDQIRKLYTGIMREYQRVLRPGGRLVLLVSDFRALRQAARNKRLKLEREIRVRILGEPAVLSVWRNA